MPTVGQIARSILKPKPVPAELESEAAAVVITLKGKPFREQVRILMAACSDTPRFAATAAMQDWARCNSTKMAVLSTLWDKGKLPRE